MAEWQTNPYRLIVESVRDYALLLLDAVGRVTSWNAGAQAIKGYSAQEIIGQHFSVFYPPEERATKPTKELEMAALHGRFEEEDWRVRKDGSRFWANVVITPVKDERGAVVGFAKVTRDLTERKQAEHEREEHRRMLRALSTPVILLWPRILLLPIVGDVDAPRAEQIMETVLRRAVDEKAKIVIIDVEGLPTMDTYVADTLLKTTAALRLLGARAVLTGIGPRVSSTMVRLGVDVSTLTTHNQLAGGLQLAFSYLGKSVTDARS